MTDVEIYQMLTILLGSDFMKWEGKAGLYIFHLYISDFMFLILAGVFICNYKIFITHEI